MKTDTKDHKLSDLLKIAAYGGAPTLEDSRNKYYVRNVPCMSEEEREKLYDLLCAHDPHLQILHITEAYTNIKKENWVKGPWEAEPDKVVAYLGAVPIMAKRHPIGGHWCGYVAVFDTHPLYGKDYDDFEDVNVYGGITFARGCSDEDCEEAIKMCHLSPEGEGPAWWLGFDCAHGEDLQPAMQHLYLGDPFGPRHYRDLPFVLLECISLARELKLVA